MVHEYINSLSNIYIIQSYKDNNVHEYLKIFFEKLNHEKGWLKVILFQGVQVVDGSSLLTASQRCDYLNSLYA